MTQREYRYEINEDLELRIWDGVNEAPFILQPFNPNDNQPWVDRDEAEAYALKTLAGIEEAERLAAEDPDYFKKKRDEELKNHLLNHNGRNIQLSPEQETLIAQAQEDSEKIRRIEEIVNEILKKLE